jgi:hypothetical protein
VRYSFHGKVRATGQQVDGFVEAPTASQAIDRLADQGIIGVYSVRPEAKIPKNSVILSGEAEPEEPEPRAERPRLEKPARRPAPAVAAPVQHAQPQQPIALPPPAASDPALTQLVDKLATLLVQVERLLSRPQQVVYQSGPIRGGGGQGSKKSGRIPTDVQNNTLRDIFQTNLDLRQSLEKLANTVGPAAPRPVAANGASHGDAPPLREAPKPVREPAHGRDLVIQAQPAA